MGGVNPPSRYTRVTGAYDRFAQKIGRFIRREILIYSEKGNIKGKRHLFSGVELNEVQKAQIDELFQKNYGRKIPYDWHRLYQSYTGEFRANYFPEILLTTQLEPLLNPYNIAEFLCDKNLLHTLFEGTARIPKTYFSCVGGKYRDHDRRYVCREEIIKSLLDIGECIIKKTIDTSSGRDVMLCCFKNGIDTRTDASVERLVDMFGDDFVVQERIAQCTELAVLNASSLNTFRIMTYLLNGKVYNCPSSLRLGRCGSEKDNMHAGGIAIGITDSGTLRRYAFAEQGERFEVHPDSGTRFEGYKIPHFMELLETSRKLHERMPYLGLLSWDLTLDEQYHPVLIEMNPVRQSSWFPQMVNGEPLFGENTASMLQLIHN